MAARSYPVILLMYTKILDRANHDNKSNHAITHCCLSNLSYHSWLLEAVMSYDSWLLNLSYHVTHGYWSYHVMSLMDTEAIMSYHLWPLKLSCHITHGYWRYHVLSFMPTEDIMSCHSWLLKISCHVIHGF